MQVPRNDHIAIENRIWNGAGAGARAVFIHFGSRLNMFGAELLLLGLILFEHQKTTYFPQSVRRGRLPGSNRLAKTPTRCFYFFSDHFCNNVLVSSHDVTDKKRNSRLHDLYSASPPRRPPVMHALLGSLVAPLATLLPPIGVFTLAFSLAALSIVRVGAASSIVLLEKTLPNSCPAIFQTGVVFSSRPASSG